MDRFRKYTGWIVMFGLIAFAVAVFFMFTGSGNASGYVKDHYPLVDVQGKGKESAKVYAVEGKDVITVANEIAAAEKPKEKSKESADRMFLMYDDKIVNVQKDPKDEKNTLVEIDSVSYAKSHYDSSFLQGYLTASLIQSLFGNGWSGGGGSYDYRGYNTTPQATSSQANAPPAAKKDTPSTSDRSGSFKSKDAVDAGQGAATAPGSSANAGSGSAKPGTSSSSGSSGSFNTNKSSSSGSSSGSSGSFSTNKSSSSGSSSSSSSSVRKNDGSSVKTPSKPSTSARSGSFSKRK